MTVRRPLIALLAIASLSLGACSSDDKASDAERSTTTEATEDTAAPSTDATTTTLPDSDRFTGQMAEMETLLDEAGDDVCSVGAATTEFAQAGEPETPDDVKVFVAFYAKLLNRIAETLPDDSGVNGQALSDGATALAAEAEAKGYPVDLLTGGTTPDSFADPAIAEAMQNLGMYLQTACTKTEG